MQSTLSNLVFSKLSRQSLHPPKASIFWRCVLAADFSTIKNPGRSMGGDSRRDDGSEDLFLRSLNFGDEGSEEQRRLRQESPMDQPPARSTLRSGQQRRMEPPLPAEDGIGGASGDLFPDFDLGDDALGETGSGLRRRPPRRPMTQGSRREDFDRSPQSSFKDFGRGYMDGFGISQHGSPSRSSSGDRREDLDDGIRRESGRIEDSLAHKSHLGEFGRHKKMEEANEKPSTLMESSGEEAPPEDADLIFRKMKETGLIPNAVAMLDGLCKDGLVQEAMKLFGLMREKGTIPEVVIYTAVVEGFCKASKFDDAKRIFRKMQKNGITPNAFSYKILIQGLCKGKKLEDSVDFCIEMLDAGHSPSAATLIGLVDEFIEDKGVEEAERLMRRLLERGFILDDKAVREHLDKKGPFKPMVWDVILGKKNSQGPF